MRRAVVFDLDGVLIDSEPIWDRVTRDLLAQHGRAFERTLADQHMGMRLPDVVAVLLESHDLDLDGEAFGRALIDALLAEFDRSLAPMPGAHDALALAASLGLKTGIATSSPRRAVEVAASRFGWRPDAICSGDDVAHGKPAPDVYLLAAERLGVRADACVAIEDSLNGVRSAREAGMYCIGVPRPRARDAIAREADLTLPSLEALTREHLG
ncbi:MAG: HAD family hydrolase [Planctomycetota bacterium]|jgi:HAD superfamily hydrolase (TIGR01509 family)